MRGPDALTASGAHLSLLLPCSHRPLLCLSGMQYHFPGPHTLFHLISLPWDLEPLHPFDAALPKDLNLPLRRQPLSPGLSYLLSPLLLLGWQRKLSFHAKWTHYKIILTLSLLFGNSIHFS